MNRIVLVCPDYRNNVFSSPGLPVGLGYVARALEGAGIEYEVLDLNIDPLERLFRRVSEWKPQFIGISMMSWGRTKTYRLLSDVKRAFPELQIIAGGPGVTTERDKVMADCPAIDIGVVGEGEVGIVEILHGKPLHSVQGLLYRESGQVRFTGRRDFVDSLDDIPFPTYLGFKLDKYGTTMSLHSSRGCPYKCIFCGGPRILGAKWRKRSADKMFEETEYWYQRGYRRFYFSDSNFAVDKKRVLAFCEQVERHNLQASLIADGLRADHLDRDLLEHMRRAGFTAITIGVESGSDRVLGRLKKGETRDQIESALVAASGLGFKVTLFFLIGSPGEEEDDIRQSFELALKYDVAKVYFFTLTPLPGTEFYDWTTERGYWIESNYPEENYGFSEQACVRTDVMTANDVTLWIARARFIERQVEWRQKLQRGVERLTRQRVRSNNAVFNVVSWLCCVASSTLRIPRWLWHSVGPRYGRAAS